MGTHGGLVLSCSSHAIAIGLSQFKKAFWIPRCWLTEQYVTVKVEHCKCPISNIGIGIDSSRCLHLKISKSDIGPTLWIGRSRSATMKELQYSVQHYLPEYYHKTWQQRNFHPQHRSTQCKTHECYKQIASPSVMQLAAHLHCEL